MKILFLYNDAIHAWPLLEARDAAAELGLEIHACHNPATHGVQSSRFRGYDCVLIHQELMSFAVAAAECPIVILERIDGAQLGKSRQWITSAAAVLKGYALRPRELNNEYRGRVHAHTLAAAGFRGLKTSIQEGKPPGLPPQALARIFAFYGFGAYQSRMPCLEVDPGFDRTRPIAVHFAGTTSYAQTEIEVHRYAAVKTCRRIKGGMAHAPGLDRRRPLRPEKYREQLLASRCVLSPWGYGEACHRDYEAWLLGCILIKPDSDYVEGCPDVYRSGETYFACRPDFRDVPELVERVRLEWEQLRPMRERCRQMAEEAASPQAIAERLKAILEQVL